MELNRQNIRNQLTWDMLERSHNVLRYFRIIQCLTFSKFTLLTLKKALIIEIATSQ